MYLCLQAKTANIWMANEIERRYGSHQGLHANSVMPGGIWTPLLKYADPNMMAKWTESPELPKYSLLAFIMLPADSLCL